MPKLTSEQLFNLLMDLLDTTTPYKSEDLIRSLIPQGGFTDKAGNYWYRVGTEDEADTLFCCHLDTVGFKPEKTHPFYHKGKIYAMSNTSACLGGDDRCGVLCLTAMINAGIKGVYLFHVGEEKGTVGASYVSKTYDMSCFKRAIEFDRRGTTSIITVMVGSVRTCSEDFAKALAAQLNAAGTNLQYKPDDTGIFTDVFEYNTIIPEVTNLSVGFRHEHSNSEHIEADWLIQQFIPALYEIKWNELPTVRDPSADNHVNDYSRYSHWSSKGRNDSSLFSEPRFSKVEGQGQGKGNKKKSKKQDDHVTYYDFEHGFGEFNNNDNDVSEIDGLSVFDEGDLFNKCNFCGEGGDSVKEYYFDGHTWALCDSCKEFLQFEEDVKSEDEDTPAQALRKAISCDETTKSEFEPDVIVEINSIDEKESDAIVNLADTVDGGWDLP